MMRGRRQPAPPRPRSVVGAEAYVRAFAALAGRVCDAEPRVTRRPTGDQWSAPVTPTLVSAVIDGERMRRLTRSERSQLRGFIAMAR